MTPKTFLASCLLISLCLLYGCGESESAGSGDYHQRIHYSATTKYWWRQFVPGHGPSAVTLSSLRIDGIKFQYVIGLKPAYIDVPGHDAILFVTDQFDPKTGTLSARAMNLYDFKTKRHILFSPRGALLFNQCSTMGAPKGWDAAVEVEQFDGETLVLLQKTWASWDRMYFNLISKRYYRMELKTLDRNNPSTDPAKPNFGETNEFHY